MKKLLLNTLIISVTCSFAVESNDSMRAYRELFPAGVPDGRVKIQAFCERIFGDEYAEYVQGMPIVIYVNLFSVPAQKKQQIRNYDPNIYPLVLGQTVIRPKPGGSPKQDEPTPREETKIYISKAWKRNINFTLYNAKGASLGTTVSSLKKNEGLDDSIAELTTYGIREKWVIEGDQTKNLLPGKYTLTMSLGPISQTNLFVIAEYKGQQKSVFTVSNAYVSFLRGEYNEAIDLAKDAMTQGGRMANDKRNHAIVIMALSYERMGDCKAALRLWEEFEEKYVSDIPQKGKQPSFLNVGEISDLKERIKNSEGRQGSPH